MEYEDSRKIESLKKQKTKADRKGNFKEEADICNYLGEIYARCDRYDDAIEEHERELALNELLSDKIGIAVANRKLGECYCKKGEFQRALKLHKKYLTLARECNNDLEEQRALATIGKTYLDQRDVGIPGICRAKITESAKKAFSDSLLICEKLRGTISQTEYMDMKARLLLNLGLVYDGSDKAEMCNNFLVKALDVSKKEQLLDVLYLCQCSLGDLHQRNGRYKEASQCMGDAASTARKMKDKQFEADALYGKAMIAVITSEFKSARHLLKVSHKVALSGSIHALKVLTCYKTVRKIEQLVRDAEAADDTDWDTLIPVYDKLGDLTAELGLYKLAVTYYQKMLSSSISAGKEQKDIAVIHVSIAETLKDDKQFDKAIAHYKKEIDCRTPQEQDQICNSLMSIGLLQEQCGLSYKDVQITYVDAFNAAKKAKNLKLQVRSLKYLIELFKLNKAEKLLTKVEDQMSRLQQKHDLTDTLLKEEEESQEVDEEDEVEEEEDFIMSDLTESEDETEKVNNTRTLRSVRSSKTFSKKVKLTEFGETPLHKACIAGDIERVKSLLAEGHPLNVQDNNGWTPLHEAANNGHYEVTELLLNHGANIDHRGGKGCEGLTPLIDAASAGNFDIMMLLIDKGASVNAKDDRQMKALDHLLAFKEGCGELDREDEIKYRNVLQLLRERDPGYRSKHGNSKIRLSQRTSSALVPESEKRLSNNSKPRSRNDIIMASDSDSDDDLRTRLVVPSQIADDSPDDLPYGYTNPHIQDIVDPDINASRTYRQAISEVGRSGCHASQTKTSSVAQKERSALLQEDEMVDDWLINDIQPIKRRKVDTNGYMSTFGVRTKKSSTDSPSQRLESTQRRESSGRKKRQLSSDSDSNSESEEVAVNVRLDDNDEVDGASSSAILRDDMDNNQDMDFDDEDVRVLFEDVGSDTEAVIGWNASGGESLLSKTKNISKTKSKMKPKQLKVTEFTHKLTACTNSDNVAENSVQSVIRQESSERSTVGHDKPVKNVLKVKVDIKGEVFFIPVIESNGVKTFSWLAEEAASRYYKKFGLKPHVTLGTKDGAHFSPDDVISLMVSDSEKIDGFLEGWDLPPVKERYSTACRIEKTVVYKNVQQLLQNSETMGKLELSNLALRAARFKPVIKAIQCQTCLRHLDIKGNRIGDLGVESLCKVLSTLPNLTHLGLVCNDVTPEGLKHLCATLASDTDKPLQSLCSLDLSHNPLYDNCLPQLAGLVSSLPSLSQLGLSSCNFTVKLFQNNRLQLTEALHNSSVQHIDISYNSLGCVGIELFLKCQNPTKIQTLDLSGTLTGAGSTPVYRHLYNYTTQDKCALQTLKLCNCNLGMDDTDFLTRLPSLAKQLQQLDLSGNSRLTNQVLQQLLQSSTTESSQLEELYLNSCKMCSPLGVDLLDCLAEKLAAQVPLRQLEFTCHKLEKVDTESLGQVWKDKWEELASVTCEGQSVRLTVIDR